MCSICFKFSAILSVSTDNEKRKFLLNVAYSQVRPSTQLPTSRSDP